MLRMQKSSFSLKIAKPFLVLAIFAALLSSCSDSATEIASEEYFPLRVGYQWIYDVEEITTLRNLCADDGVTTTTYELKVEIISSAVNAEGGTTYTFQRSKRSGSAPWTPLATWTAQRKGTQLVANEANIVFVKLVFPVSDGLSWNGNQYNTQLQLNKVNVDTYAMASVHQPYAVSANLSFPKTVTVIQNAEENNITRRDSRKEVYALGVGLAFKESIELEYFIDSNPPNNVCLAQKRVKKGSTWKQTLKEFSAPK